MITKNIVKVGVIGLLALLLLVMPLMTACAEEKPGIVKVGYLADLTGPYAAVGAPLVQAFQDYFEMINARGGIEGVQVEVLVADTQAKADLSVSAYKRFKAEGVLTLSCMVTPVALAVQTLLNEDKIPGINQTATLSIYAPPQDYMWCHGGVASDYDLAALFWFDTELWDRDEWGSWTLGILAHDNPFALGGVSAMYKYADTRGIKLLKPEVVALGTLDYSTNIMRLVDAGADVIFCETLGAGTGTLLKQMGELGVLGTIEEAATIPGKMVPFFGYTSYYVSNMLTGIEYASYTYGARGFASASEEEFPGVKECNDFMREKYGKVLPPEEGGTDYREGWHNAMVMTAAIERAVKAVGWENLNGETLMENGLKGLELDTKGFSGGTGYADYTGDRINVQSFKFAFWDDELGDVITTGNYLNIPELLPECEVTDYMTTQGGTGWYTP
ncbi:MAG TPA: ABC transporter substrate-binding protein [Dehalococcoidia bacterium]|nr:ABC transporter substrate-binding protein [Dehalococcoidia bacterium]